MELFDFGQGGGLVIIYWVDIKIIYMITYIWNESRAKVLWKKEELEEDDV